MGANGKSRGGRDLSLIHRHILGIRPDLVIEIREDILEETDGPMLIHGLQGFQDKRILVPRSPLQQPNRDFLAERYGLFRKAS